MEGCQESDPRGRGKQRERQQAAQEWRQGIDESERQVSSLIRGYAGKVDRRAAKAEPPTRPGTQRARWGAHRLLARAQITESGEGGIGSRSGLQGGSHETRTRARAGSAVHARGSGIRGSTHGRGGGTTQTSADDLHGARGSAAGKSDRVLLSVQGEGGLINGGNSSSAAQGKGDDDVQLARSDQQRGREGARECRTEGSRSGS